MSDMKDPASAGTPHRAVRILLDIDADSRKDLEAAFRHFLHTFDNRSAPSGCSGGYSSGWTYQMWESDHPTHDEYEAMLAAYLDRRDAELAHGLAAPSTTSHRKEKE